MFTGVTESAISFDVVIVGLNAKFRLNVFRNSPIICLLFDRRGSVSLIRGLLIMFSVVQRILILSLMPNFKLMKA